MKSPKVQDQKLYVLRRIAAAVGTNFNLEPVLQTAVDELGKALQASRCMLYQFDASELLSVTHEYNSPGIAPMGVGNSLVLPSLYMANQLSQPIHVNDVMSDERFQDPIARQLLRELEIRSVIAVPLIFQGKKLAILGIDQCQQMRHWSTSELELSETVAAQLAVLVQSCRVFAQQEQLTDSLAGMNEDLSRLYVQLSFKDEQIDRFMHLISHDLRSPIVAIQGLVDLLKHQYEDEPPDSIPRRYLELIHRSTEQITTLTTMLLDYARLGRSTLKLEDVNTAELVLDLWQRIAHSIPEATFETLGALPVVKADRHKLTQIFQNLLENAVKYRKLEGPLVVDVSGQEKDNSWQFAINDNGIGFHPSQAESIFDLFSRLKEAQHKPGTGIGLASVFEIARLHGGTAWAIGRPANGSTFYFTIGKRLSEQPSTVTAK